jgi:hypothetical protein
VDTWQRFDAVDFFEKLGVRKLFLSKHHGRIKLTEVPSTT